MALFAVLALVFSRYAAVFSFVAAISNVVAKALRKAPFSHCYLIILKLLIADMSIIIIIEPLDNTAINFSHPVASGFVKVSIRPEAICIADTKDIRLYAPAVILFAQSPPFYRPSPIFLLYLSYKSVP
jgi:hypothetical protein